MELPGSLFIRESDCNYWTLILGLLFIYLFIFYLFCFVGFLVVWLVVCLVVPGFEFRALCLLGKQSIT
jgi:hypothetical protein